MQSSLHVQVLVQREGLLPAVVKLCLVLVVMAHQFIHADSYSST